MVMSNLPTAPATSDPSTFAARADAFVAALSTFVTEANVLAASGAIPAGGNITNNQDTNTTVNVFNNNSGTSARSSFIAESSAGPAYFMMHGSSFTPSGVNKAGGLLIASGGAGGISLATLANQPLYFAVNNTEVGQANASRWYLEIALHIKPGTSVTPVNNGDIVFEFTNNTTLTIKGKGSDGTVRSGTITL